MTDHAQQHDGGELDPDLDYQGGRPLGGLLLALVLVLASVLAIVFVAGDRLGIGQADDSLSSEVADPTTADADTTTDRVDEDPVLAVDGQDSSAGGEEPDDEPELTEAELAAARSIRPDAPISVVGMSSLSNVRLRTNRATYRFTAEQTGEVEALRLYFIVNTSRPGYASGNGGTVSVTVAPDDGTGLPDESRLLPGRFDATFDLANGAPTGDRGDFIKNTLLGRWAFSEPIPVEAGQSYHFIFTNTDADPDNNFVSLDLVIDLLPDSDTSGQPIPSPARRTDIGFVEDRAGQPWFIADTHSSGHWRTPIFQVDYVDGTSQGQGFMQYETSDAFQLSGSSALRTTITLPADRTVSQLAARVAQHPTAPVILELTDGDGEVLRSVSVPANGQLNYRSAVWVEGTVEPITLEAGQTYALVVRAGEGYSGSVTPLQAGLTYGFSSAAVYPFGVAQTSTDGSSWSDWRSGLFYFSFSVK